MNKILLLFFAFFVVNAFSQEKTTPQILQPGAKAVDFKLKGVDEKLYTLSSFDNSKILVIVFSAPHCPTAQVYEDRLINIQNEYKSKGV